MSEGFFLWGLLAGYLWGGWFADRRAERDRAYHAGTTLILTMLADIREKRRFVGRGLTITRSEVLNLKGEDYLLSLASKGNPEAMEREPAA